MIGQMNNIRVSVTYRKLTSATSRRIRLQTPVSESQCAIAASVWASAHGRLFAAAVELPRWPIYFLAVRANGERVATFSHFPHSLVQSACVLHKHEAFALSHVLRLYPSRNLDVARRIYNYRLTRARRVEFAFGTVCNKWRIFHCATDVCPDFCDVNVKTRCILHNFVRQRDGCQFQNTLGVCPLESIKAIGTRSNVTGTDVGRRAQGTGISLRGGPVGEPGRGLVYRGFVCRRPWRCAPLSIDAPLGRMGGSVHREF